MGDRLGKISQSPDRFREICEAILKMEGVRAKQRGTPRSAAGPGQLARWRESPLVLLILIGVLIVAVTQVVIPRYYHHFVSFSPGDIVHDRATGENFGEIKAFKKKHPFWPQVKADAYLVHLYVPPYGEHWLPVIDLHRSYRRGN